MSKKHNPDKCQDPNCQLPGCKDPGGLTQEEMTRDIYKYVVGAPGQRGLLQRMDSVEKDVGYGKMVASLIVTGLVGLMFDRIKRFFGLIILIVGVVTVVACQVSCQKVPLPQQVHDSFMRGDSTIDRAVGRADESATKAGNAATQSDDLAHAIMKKADEGKGKTPPSMQTTFWPIFDEIWAKAQALVQVAASMGEVKQEVQGLKKELVEAKQSYGEAQKAAKEQVTTMASRIEGLEKDNQRKSQSISREMRTIRWITVGIMAAAIALLVWQKWFSFAFAVAVSGLSVIGVTMLVGWFDDYKFYIFGGLAAGAVAYLGVETIVRWKWLNKGVSLGAAFMLALMTTPAQDVVDIEAKGH